MPLPYPDHVMDYWTFWTFYVLRCADGSLYAGATRDVTRRTKEHEAGPPKGSKYVHSHKPFRVVMTEIADDRSGALKLEAEFKKLTKAQKEVRVREYVKARAKRDAMQDYLENAFWGSVRGSQKLKMFEKPDPLERPSWIHEDDEKPYLEGYLEFAKELEEKNL